MSRTALLCLFVCVPLFAAGQASTDLADEVDLFLSDYLHGSLARSEFNMKLGRLFEDAYSSGLLLLLPPRESLSLIVDDLVAYSGNFHSALVQSKKAAPVARARVCALFGQAPWPISYSLSFSTFRAAALTASSPRVILGIDTLGKSPLDDAGFEAVIGHELIHLVHSRLSPSFTQSIALKSLADILWFEGIACFGSRLVSPKASMSAILGTAELPSHVVKEVARDLLDSIDAVGMWPSIVTSGSLVTSAGRSVNVYAVGYALIESVCQLDASSLAVLMGLSASSAHGLTERWLRSI